ncbi:hypothetical protein R5W24_000019 [Gemmata sp. JC717]|uniref:hypothetical protein n=1 Tax=Gemmata algarum TaxID=2975278 RepID=UPI0021BB70FF|nr:hypothetical protein [Gemmata algarum]MDY3550950.1 hypothetical protein [Gemmata algarum]
MTDSRSFAIDVFRTVCDRLAAKAAELRLLVEAAVPFGEWLNREAFLACKHREASYPFCEVTAEPTYASEGVPNDDSSRDRGGLRVGGPDNGAHHCWAFAEFVLVHDGNRAGGEWLREFVNGTDRLLRLGWKKSAALLVAVTASGDGRSPDAPGWDRPSLTDPFVIPLPGGGTVVLTAFDIKQNPADTLAVPAG